MNVVTNPANPFPTPFVAPQGPSSRAPRYGRRTSPVAPSHRSYTKLLPATTNPDFQSLIIPWSFTSKHHCFGRLRTPSVMASGKSSTNPFPSAKKTPATPEAEAPTTAAVIFRAPCLLGDIENAGSSLSDFELVFTTGGFARNERYVVTGFTKTSVALFTIPLPVWPSADNAPEVGPQRRFSMKTGFNSSLIWGHQRMLNDALCGLELENTYGLRSFLSILEVSTKISAASLESLITVPLLLLYLHTAGWFGKI